MYFSCKKSTNKIKAYRKKIEKRKRKHNILGGHLVRLILDWLVVLITISSLIDTEILLFPEQTYVSLEEWRRQQIFNC